MDPAGADRHDAHGAVAEEAVGDEVRSRQEAGQAEEPEEEDYDDDALPSYLSGPQDPARMSLSSIERQWAKDLKAAVESDPELDDISDYMYAQIAIVQGGNLQKGVEQAYKMQEFRREFGIQDTFQDGKRALKVLQEKLPCHLLHFFYVPPVEAFSLVTDLGRLDTSAFSTWNGKQIIMTGNYYLLNAENHDLQCVRRGILFVLDCKACSLGMINYSMFRLIFEDVISMYPFRSCKIKYMNAGAMISTLIGAVRKFAPKHFSDQIELEHHSDTCMSDVCLVPNKEVAERRVLRDLTEALRRRYENEKTFRL